MIRLISNERGDTALVEAYRTLRSTQSSTTLSL